MLKTYILLPDGTEISSGPGAVHAVQSCSFTECVNSAAELTLGSVCAAMVEVKLITPGGLTISAGDELRIYQQEGGVRYPLGIFIAEKPTRPSANIMKITAYDRVSLLDKDLTAWVNGLAGWPYSLQELASMVCDQCGLALTDTQLPNGSHLVRAFTAVGITGRRLMQWIGQAAGRFCRATADGKLEFAWYAPVEGHSVGTTPRAMADNLDAVCDGQTLKLTMADATVTGEGDMLSILWDDLTAAQSGNVLTLTAAGQTRQHFYFQGGLSFADYTVAPIEKIQISATDQDVGTQWPPDTQGNTLRITGNPLLTADSAQSLQNVAQTLLAQLENATYTPCTVTVPATPHIRAGHILTVTDRLGRSITTWVMTKKQSGHRDTLECTGSPRRDSATVLNEQSYTALSGKVMNLRADVEGLKAENKAADGRAASLELTVDGISARVEKHAAEAAALRTELTAVQQTADAVKIAVQSIRENGASKVKTAASYTFDDTGLHIARSGQTMENKLDNTGMYVLRSGQVILQANSDGVTATDVRVRNYLCVGENARFEDYEGSRTACFFTGG